MIIKPAVGGNLLIQDRAGGAVLSTGTSGATIASNVTGIPAAGVTGVLPAAVTGGSGLTELGTVTSGNLSNTAIVYPAGHVIQVTYNHTSSQTTHTNQHTNVITHSITRENASNDIFVIGSVVWGMANPNGHWRLNRSYSSDMSSPSFIHGTGALDDVVISERLSTSRQENFTYFDESASSSNATVYYALQFYHNVQNGGTLYVNRPHTYATTTIGTQTARCHLTLWEVVA